MIGSIRGKITLQTDKFIILEASNIGYKINISGETLNKLTHLDKKQQVGEILLWTHTHVREDILDLYGFLEYKELEFFELLLTISGIGPKGALSILNAASTETLMSSIVRGDTGYLTKISGIGKKTAEKMILELKDKISKNSDIYQDKNTQEELDVLEALKSLGYSQNEAREALKQVEENLDTSKKIKEALKILSKK